MDKFLETDRIRLRAVNPDDARVMWDVESDSSQWLQNCIAAPLSAHNIAEYALNYDANPFSTGQLRLIIETIDNKETIGIIDLYEISAQNRTAFVGIYIIPQFRKSGVGVESIEILKKYAFYVLNLNQLGAKIVYNNKGSINLFKKCGFIQSGKLPNWILSGSKRMDLYLFTINLDCISETLHHNVMLSHKNE